MSENKILSIVIPIYNVERYLSQCLDSMVNQTNSDFEVILVNDGSKDKSGEIAKKYSEKYPELFTYIEQENKGLGAARNAGLKNVRTEFVKFLDSDDWILPNVVDLIVKRLKKEKYAPDICFMNPKVFNMATNSYEKWMDEDLLRSIFSDVRITSPSEDVRMYDLEPSVCRSVFRVDFLRDLNFRFPEGIKWEDIQPHFILYKHAKRCIYIEDAGFIYRVNSGNQITSGSGAGRLDMIKVFSSLIYMAYREEWTEQEIAKIIKCSVSYLRWSIDASNKDVRKKLCYNANKIYRMLPKKYVKHYYKYAGATPKDIRYFKFLRNPILFRVLYNRNFVELSKDVKNNLKFCR